LVKEAEWLPVETEIHASKIGQLTKILTHHAVERCFKAVSLDPIPG
jgi:hypothetical protein